MKIYDISRTLQEAPVYPGDEPAVIRRVANMEQGDDCNVSSITAGSHLGTHADAFSHFIRDGLTIDQIPLESFCGKCRVISTAAGEMVRLSDLQGKIGGFRRIALHTGGNGVLTEEAADYLVQCGVKLVVIDSVSVSPEEDPAVVHCKLLGSGVAVVENADLAAVPDGDYLIFAFPVKIGGCDGAPVRAVLLQDA